MQRFYQSTQLGRYSVQLYTQKIVLKTITNNLLKKQQVSKIGVGVLKEQLMNIRRAMEFLMFSEHVSHTIECLLFKNIFKFPESVSTPSKIGVTCSQCIIFEHSSIFTFWESKFIAFLKSYKKVSFFASYCVLRLLSICIYYGGIVGT